MNSRIADYQSRPRRYFNIDGVGELSMGFMALGFGVLQWLQLSSPRDSIWNQTYTLFAFTGVIVAITHYGPRAIKERVTYPRTGYVKYREDSGRQLVASVGALLAAMVLSGVLVWNRFEFSVAPALVGVVLAASYAYGFARIVRWKWFVAAVLAVSAVAISTLPSKVAESWADPTHLSGPFPPAAMGRFVLLTAFYGVTLLISGAVTFVLYLRSTRPERQETV